MELWIFMKFVDLTNLEWNLQPIYAKHLQEKK